MMCVCVTTCGYVNLYVSTLQGPEDVSSLGARITGTSEPPDWMLGTEVRSSAKEILVLPPEKSIQPPWIICYRKHSFKSCIYKDRFLVTTMFALCIVKMTDSTGPYYESSLQLQTISTIKAETPLISIVISFSHFLVSPLLSEVHTEAVL